MNSPIYNQPNIFNPRGKSGFITGFIVAFALIIFVFAAFAFVTKAGIINNFLNIGVLEPTATNNTNTSKSVHPVGPTTYSIETPDIGKPVIYLYPRKETKVNVTIDFPGEMVASYPEYKNGWEVMARSDGKILNIWDNKEYNYLFWEGNYEKQAEYDLSEGFIVKGGEAASFLQEKLKSLGLLPNEYNEFIAFWQPKMQNNTYNLVHFATREEYDDKVILNIIPKPDSIRRIFMVFKPIDQPANIEPQKIEPFERNGFTAIEWGGTQL